MKALISRASDDEGSQAGKRFALKNDRQMEGVNNNDRKKG